MQKNISASDKALITDLDKQIRDYVKEYGTRKDSELLDQAIFQFLEFCPR